jgi:hypothetical protein
MKTVSYQYDAEGRPTVITPPSPGLRRNYSYTARGELAAVTTGTAATALVPPMPTMPQER